tara:strand:+ start:600 stop:755 length:156 start_codon:yes stop_codon:yes gene_type:complete
MENFNQIEKAKEQFSMYLEFSSNTYNIQLSNNQIEYLEKIRKILKKEGSKN